MANNKKPFRFYSREEYRALMPFIKAKGRLNFSELADFCKKYNRPVVSVSQYIHKCRKTKRYARAKRNSNKVNSLIVPKTTNNTTASVKKGEFKVPINNWNLTFENGKAFFTVNF